MTCGPHSIRLDVSTEKAFHGRVFVKGEAERRDCSRGFGYSDADAEPSYGDRPRPFLLLPDILSCRRRLRQGRGFLRRQRLQSRPRRHRAQLRGLQHAAAEDGELALVPQVEVPRFWSCQLYPRGVEYTLTIVISFHPLFITKVLPHISSEMNACVAALWMDL